VRRSHTLEQVNEFLVLGGGWRHGNDGALVWNVENRFAVHLPARVRQARHELVQLCHEVVLDATATKTAMGTVSGEDFYYQSALDVWKMRCCYCTAAICRLEQGLEYRMAMSESKLESGKNGLDPRLESESELK